MKGREEKKKVNRKSTLYRRQSRGSSRRRCATVDCQVQERASSRDVHVWGHTSPPVRTACIEPLLATTTPRATRALHGTGELLMHVPLLGHLPPLSLTSSVQFAG